MFENYSFQVLRLRYVVGLPAGAYEFKVIGRNSKGDGPQSAGTTINVA